MLASNRRQFGCSMALRVLIGGAAGSLVACGGGGGGGTPAAPVPAPKGAATVPQFVDSADYNVLAFQPATTLLVRGYGRALDAAYLPNTAVWSDASVTPGASMALVDSVGADIRFLPGALSLSMSMNGLPYVDGGTDAAYGPLIVNMVASSHTVGGTTLKRFQSDSMPNNVNICVALLDASALGVRYARPVYWRYRNYAAPGYPGAPEVRASHVMGVHTSAGAVGSQASATYSGVFFGTIAAATETVTYALDEVSARIQVSVDVASRTVTFAPQGAMAYQQNDCLTSGLSARGSVDQLSLQWDSLGCQSTLDGTTKAARCTTQLPDGSMTVEYRAQFFGPDAREFAGTVHFRGSLNGSSVANASITGAFVATRQPLVP